MSSYLQKLRTLDARSKSGQHGGHTTDRTLPRRADAPTGCDDPAVEDQRGTNYEITPSGRAQQPQSTNRVASAALQQQDRTKYEITSRAPVRRQQSTNYETTSLRHRSCSPPTDTNYEITPSSAAQLSAGTNYEIASPACSPPQITNYETTLSARPQPERGTNYEITSPAMRQSAQPRRAAVSGDRPQETRKSVEAALKRYVSQRLAALGSLDSETISSWLRAYGMHWPSGRDFWIRVHRMRTWPLVGLSEAERARSRRWLDGVARELGAYFWDERLAARLERVPGTGGGNSLGAHCIRGEVQMDINEYLGGDHLRREDVPKPILVTVTEVTVKEFDNPPEKKAVLHFEETEKTLVMNKTNGKITKTVFETRDTEQWKGKKIVVYDDPNIFFAGKQTGGLRLRAPKAPEGPQEDVPF